MFPVPAIDRIAGHLRAETVAACSGRLLRPGSAYRVDLDLSAASRCDRETGGRVDPLL
ncbi:hypothetical protein ACQEVF_21195 [Nonomuraea polychroma]|uniref:hypothetical protein n=1 Tax=Nonomuraea polychroma TaxID=46176 RepID=UPI003D8F1B03